MMQSATNRVQRVLELSSLPPKRQLWILKTQLVAAQRAWLSHGNIGSCPCCACLVSSLRIAVLDEEML